MTAPKPKPTRRTRLVLVPDIATGHVTRHWRRGDCARLSACELQFIAAHGSAQGRCPKQCAAFVARVG